MLKPITFALTLAASPLTAETDACAQTGTLAAKIMEARQVGVPLSDIISIFEGDELMRGLVMIAYEQPRYSTDEYRQEAITDFANDVVLGCLKAQD